MACMQMLCLPSISANQSHLPSCHCCVCPAQVDFNLHGMGHLRLSQVLFRDPLPASSRPPAADMFASLPILPSPATSSQQGQQPSQPFRAASQQGQGQQQQAGADTPAGTPGSSSQQLASTFWTASTVPADWRWSSTGLPARDMPVRESTCQLEADACVEHVLNRLGVGSWGAGSSCV